MWNIEKNNTKKNGHTYVVETNEDHNNAIAVCYGRLVYKKGMLKETKAIDDAALIVNALNLYETIQNFNKKTSQKRIMEIIELYKK